MIYGTENLRGVRGMLREDITGFTLFFPFGFNLEVVKVKGKIKEIINNYWIPVNYNKKKDEKSKANLVEYLWNYYTKTAQLYKEIIEVEKPFSFIEKELVISGKIDLLVKNKEEKTELIDFKTRNIEGIDATMVDLQLRMYNIALENDYNISQLSAYTFKDNMKTPFSNTPEDLRKAKDTIINVGKQVKNEEFEKNLNGRFCKACMYSFLCDLSKGNKK